MNKLKKLPILHLIGFGFCLFSINAFSQNTFPATGPVGIGTTTPNNSSLLNVKNGTVLFDGSTGITPISGSGTRLMWIPVKGAFRCGNVAGIYGSFWDDANIGLYSFASGSSTKAFGASSVALGSLCASIGDASFSSGSANIAYSNSSIAMGYNSTANGNYSVAIGNSLPAIAYSATSLGSFAQIPTGTSFTSWVTTDPLFVLGNGIDGSNRSNALTIIKNGRVCIGSSMTPTQKLQVDNGNILIRGTNNFSGAGSEAYLYFGDANHYIKAKYAYGVSIGTFGQTDLLSVLESGKVTIGGTSLTSTPGSYKLYVTGGILTEKVRIATYASSSWADYVFEKNYRLRSLAEVEEFISKNQHLPEVPSAADVSSNGFDLADMNATLLKKIEELTLYLINQEKRINQLEEELKKK